MIKPYLYHHQRLPQKIAINNDVKLCYNVLSTNNKNGEINSDTDNVLMVKIHQIDDNNKDVTN